MSVNDKIRLIREAKGLTQEQIAEKLKMSANAYGNIERGDNDPKLSKLQKIAEILEIPLADLVDLSEQGSLTINFNKDGKHQNIYLGSSNTELEKQLLVNQLQAEKLAMKDRENENLREIITLLKNQGGVKC
jgi:transcriptional regulator with XRE-family HTH domain